MNAPLPSKLIADQPKPSVNADGTPGDDVKVYKDEGGKHCDRYCMRIALKTAVKRLSVGAYLECRHPACAQGCSRLTETPQFVSDQLFRVTECSRSSYCGPMQYCKQAVRVWNGVPHVWTFAAKDTAPVYFVDLKCNFFKVSSKCMCASCGGETRMRIAVATDNDLVDTSHPICIMSKRKIPASMRMKSEKEIKAFIDKERRKKSAKKALKTPQEALRLKQQEQAPRAKRKRSASQTSTRQNTPRGAQYTIEQLNERLKRLEEEMKIQRAALTKLYERKSKRQRIELREKDLSEAEHCHAPLELEALPKADFTMCDTDDMAQLPLPLPLHGENALSDVEGYSLEDWLASLD